MSKAARNRIICRLERLTLEELEELDRTTAKMVDRAVMAAWEAPLNAGGPRRRGGGQTPGGGGQEQIKKRELPNVGCLLDI